MRIQLWRRIRLGCLRGSALVAFTLGASAGDFYVDAIQGNNANGGAGPGDAWRTITYALSRLPWPPTGLAERIHVAPGVYDTALGEHFPFVLQFHDGVQIVSSHGPAATVLDGGGAAQILVCVRSYHSGFSGPLTLVGGFTLRNAQSALLMGSSEGSLQLTCRDLVVQGMTDWAVQVTAGTVAIPGVPHGTFERVRMSDCGGGIRAVVASTSVGSPHILLTLEDVTIERSRSDALRVEAPQFASATLQCKRTRLVDNGGDGIAVRQLDGLSASGVASTTIEDCLIAGNAGAGLLAAHEARPPAAGATNQILTTVRRSTLAHNLGAGLDLYFTTLPPQQTVTLLEGSIVYGNGDDVRENPAQPSIAAPSYNDIGDGDFAGANCNISAAPLFRDVSAGDFRLLWGSPCADAGDPLTPAGLLDLTGVTRSIDGDYDTVEVADIGCHEFRTLDAVAAPQPNHALELEHFGPTGGVARLFASRGEPFAVPIQTAWGEVDIDLLVARGLSLSALGPPAVRWLWVPGNPALIGQTFTFQALANPVAGQLAFTNALRLVVEP